MRAAGAFFKIRFDSHPLLKPSDGPGVQFDCPAQNLSLEKRVPGPQQITPFPVARPPGHHTPRGPRPPGVPEGWSQNNLNRA